MQERVTECKLEKINIYFKIVLFSSSLYLEFEEVADLTDIKIMTKQHITGDLTVVITTKS